MGLSCYWVTELNWTLLFEFVFPLILLSLNIFYTYWLCEFIFLQRVEDSDMCMCAYLIYSLLLDFPLSSLNIEIHLNLVGFFSSVQSLSCVRLFATPWITARQASLPITNSWSSLRFTSIESVMPSSRLILCRPLLLLPPTSPSIRVFSNKSTLRMRWPKYWSFSFSIIPSKEIPGLISFRMDWLDLLAVQGTLESSPTPQFKSINSLVLSFLHSPTLTSIHDYWKNHSLD